MGLWLLLLLLLRLRRRGFRRIFGLLLFPSCCALSFRITRTRAFPRMLLSRRIVRRRGRRFRRRPRRPHRRPRRAGTGGATLALIHWLRQIWRRSANLRSRSSRRRRLELTFQRRRILAPRLWTRIHPHE